jgi:steroid delta-isomerase-like uncharacterized protein
MTQTDTGMLKPAADLMDAFNRAAWSQFRAIVADDVLYHEIGTGRRIQGVDAYIEALAGWKHAFPDARGTILATIAVADVTAQRLRFHATHTGPLQTPTGIIEASGRHVSVDASVWYRYESEAITEIHHYLDVLTLLRQIGALPE